MGDIFFRMIVGIAIRELLEIIWANKRHQPKNLPDIFWRRFPLHLPYFKLPEGTCPSGSCLSAEAYGMTGSLPCQSPNFRTATNPHRFE